MRSLRLIRFLLIPIWATLFGALLGVGGASAQTPSPSPTPSPTLTPSATCPPTGTPNVDCDTLTPSPAPTLGPTAIASPTPSGTISPTIPPTLTPSLTPTPADAPTCLPGSPGVAVGTPIDFSVPITAPIDGTLLAPDDDTFFGPQLYSDSFSFTVNQAFGRTTYIRFEVDADPASPSPATGAGTPFQSIVQINGPTGEAHCAPVDPYDRDNRLIEARLGSGTYIFRVGLLTDPTTGANPPSDYQDYRLFIIAPDQTLATNPALVGGALDFGTVDVDGQPSACAPTNPPTTSQATVTISNPGPSLDPLLHPEVPALVVENVRVVDADGNPSPDFVIVLDDGFTTLTEGTARNITIQFDPQNPIPPGPRFAYLRFETNDPDEGVVDIPLTGIAVDPEIGLDREFIDFGGVDVDAAPTQQTINITNFGSADLQLCGIEILADMCGEFSIVSAIPSSLAPGATLPVTIQFDPVLPIGVRTGVALRIVSDDTDESVLFIPINGVSLDQEICVEPLALIFPDQDVDEGLTATQLVTITNVGNAPLNIANVVRAGVDPIDFKIVSDTDPDSGATTLAPGAARVVGVAFDPKLPIGQKNALLRITSDDTDEATVDVTMTGLALDQEIVVTGGPLAFGLQDVDAGPTASQQITIGNQGNTDLAIASIAIAGLNPSHYQISSQTCGATIAPSGSCTVDIVFDPTLPIGDKPAALRIVSDDQDEPMVDVALSGTATDQDIDVSPLAVDFGGQDVDAGATATMPVTITNVGTADLSVANAILTGPNSAEFSIVSNPCGILTPGGSCVIALAFDPALPTGPKSATLTISSDDSDEPQVDVALTGIGLDQEIEVATLPIDFGTQDVDAGQTAPIAVTISNLGNTTLNIASVTIAGGDAAQFPVVFDSGQAALAPGDTRVIQIAFDPELPEGAKATTITILSDDADEPTIAGALTGTAADQEIEVSGALAFPDQDVDAGPTATQNVTITNLGTYALILSSVSLAGADTDDFTIVSDSGEATLAPGATRTLAIAFDPNLPIRPVNGKMASIDIVSDDADEPFLSVALTGPAFDQEIDVDPLAIDFFDQDVDAGQQQGNQTVTITNLGNATLTITSVALTAGDTADFIIVNNPCTTLAENQSCVIDLNFDPSLPTGTKTATLTIGSDDTDEPTVDVILLGTATDQEIDAQPALDFPDTDIAAGPTAPQNIEIANLGNSPLFISSVALAGADAASFVIVNDTGETILSPGAVRSVDIAFDPVLPAGAKSASLEIMSDDADEATVNVPLTGNATNPEILVAPPAVEYPARAISAGPSVAEAVTITNVGTTDLSLGTVAITGPDAAEFSFFADSGETTLGSGASRIVQVTFTPGLPLGPKTAQLEIPSNDADEPLTIVPISAESVQQEIDVDPLAIDFGEKDITDPASEPTTVTITNVGTGNLAVTGVSLTGTDTADFLIVSDTGEANLGAGESRLVFVSFDPLTTGTKTANLTVISDDPDESAIDVTLLGSALNDPDIGVSPFPVIDFGDVDVDDAQVVIPFAATNEGLGSLTFDSSFDPDFGTFALQNISGPPPLGPGQSWTGEVAVNPGSVSLGTHVGRLSFFNTNDTDEPVLNIPLIVNIVDPDIDASPSPLDFGTYDPFESSNPSRTLTITNTGTGTLTLTSVTLAGPNAPLYTILNDSGETALGAGETRTVLIRMTSTNFAPPPNARVEIVSDDDDEPLLQVPLTGTQNQDGDIGASPLQLSFGSRDVDDGPTASQQVSIRNDGTSGTAAVNISSVSIVGPDAASFVILSDTGEPAINPALPGTPPVVRIVRVQFDPILGVGPKSATLRIVSDDVGETVLDIPLTGTALDQEIDVDPLSLSFPSIDVDDGATAFQTVEITNLGNAALNIASVSLGGTNPGDFTVVSDSGEASLLPGESRFVDVAFDPNAPGGAKSATLDIASDDADEALVSVTLTGTGLDQEIDVSLVAFAFGAQDVDAGPTASTTLTISNIGNADLALSSVALIGPQAGEFVVVSDTGEATLAPGASRTLQLAFDPSLPTGFRSAQVRIASDDTDEPVLYVPLFGTAVDQEITVSPLALAFGEQDIDAGPTADQAVTITNDGGSTLTLSNMMLAGADFLEFNAGISGGPVLPPGGSATVSINFDPSSVGLKNAVFTITSDDADETTITIALAGTGVDGEIQVSRLSIDFGSLDVDFAPPAPQSVAIENVGGAPLTISSVAFGGGTSGQFSLISGGGAAVLQPGEIRTAVIGFDPQLPPGAQTGTLDIASDDADEALVQVELDGVSLDQEIDVDPLTLGFGAQDVDAGATAPQNVVIDNLGNATLNLFGATIVGPNAGDFFIFNDTGETALGTTETRTLSIAFDPALPFGAKTATLRIASDDTDEPIVEVALTGLALDQEVTVDPLGPLDFGDQDIDLGPTADQVVTITNDGNSTLTLSNMTLAGADLLEFNAGISGGPILGPGESATVSISFNPSTVGAKTAAFTFDTDDADEPSFSISLTGNGVDQEIGVSPTSLTFPWLYVNDGQEVEEPPTTSQAVTITNSGTGPLAISGVALGGTDAASFLITFDSGEAILPAGASRVVQIGFDPVLPVGSKTATLTISSDDTDEPSVVVTLNGLATQFIDNTLFIAHTIPPKMTVGQSLWVGVTVLNNGTSTWSGESRFLTLIDNKDRTSVIYLPEGAVVAPGRSLQFVAEITAPNEAGQWSLEFQMVESPNKSFGDTLTVEVQVVEPVNAVEGWADYE